MGWFDTTHQDSGRRTWWAGNTIMLCGKVMRPSLTDWWPGGNKPVNCGGCKSQMRKLGMPVVGPLVLTGQTGTDLIGLSDDQVTMIRTARDQIEQSGGRAWR